MSRILIGCQEKGGVGKSTIVRALAEAVEGAPVIEIDASHRLLELEGRVSFFQMRADREAIERTGGRAARAEFDAVLDALSTATLPTIVDVGANTSVSLFTMLADVALELAAEFAVCVVVTNEPGAMVDTEAARPFEALDRGAFRGREPHAWPDRPELAQCQRGRCDRHLAGGSDSRGGSGGLSPVRWSSNRRPAQPEKAA